jgi:hypothetical protein
MEVLPELRQIPLIVIKTISALGIANRLTGNLAIVAISQKGSAMRAEWG